MYIYINCIIFAIVFSFIFSLILTYFSIWLQFTWVWNACFSEFFCDNMFSFLFFLVNVSRNETDFSHLGKAQNMLRLTELELHSAQQLLFLTDTTAPGIECPVLLESWEHDMTSRTETLLVKQPGHQQAGQWASVVGSFCRSDKWFDSIVSVSCPGAGSGNLVASC